MCVVCCVLCVCCVCCVVPHRVVLCRAVLRPVLSCPVVLCLVGSCRAVSGCVALRRSVVLSCSVVTFLYSLFLGPTEVEKFKKRVIRSQK